MALMHQTTMSPTKLELLAQWLPKQSWFDGDASALAALGGFRLDDPAGEVGLEGLLLTAGGDTVYHVPLSYRAAPLEGGEAFLLGTSEHGVLGTRWISAAVGDPVYRAVLASTIALGGHGAREWIQGPDGDRVEREPVVRVQGSGRAGQEVPELEDASAETVGALTRIENEAAVLDVVHAVDPTARAEQDQLSLGASWPGQAGPALLALLYAA